MPRSEKKEERKAAEVILSAANSAGLFSSTKTEEFQMQEIQKWWGFRYCAFRKEPDKEQRYLYVSFI